MRAIRKFHSPSHSRHWHLIACVLGILLWAFPEHCTAQIRTARRLSLRSLSATRRVPLVRAQASKTTLIGLGDSLTHGTMDARNNFVFTQNAYLQKMANSLEQVLSLRFSQPLFSIAEKRLSPYAIPTNLSVDGSDTFSAEGIEYYKRVGAPASFITENYLCDQLFPFQFDTKYDKVLYPLNLLSGQSVSQMDAVEWWLNQSAPAAEGDNFLVVLWLGNNDSSLAALGQGGENPLFLPIPAQQLRHAVSPLLSALLKLGEDEGLLSFAPYAQSSIERNLTDEADFDLQFNRLLDRLAASPAHSAGKVDVFVATLPYYSSVGYLLDSDDLEFFLQQVNPSYQVPPTFQRVAPPGQPITDPLKGDRISLLTFGFMYLLLSTGTSVEAVNEVLEIAGQQQDGMVMSEAESRFIVQRIDEFNQVIRDGVAARGPKVHLVDIGQFLNDGLTGKFEVVVGGRLLTRKWGRGLGFSLDGVHPSYTAQSIVANVFLQEINNVLGINAPFEDLEAVQMVDPYFDADRDGWMPGAGLEASGLGELLLLFTDGNDFDPNVHTVIPENVCEKVSRVLVAEFLKSIQSLETRARDAGILIEQ